MPTVKIPISGETYSNVDGIELTDKSAELYDGYLDEMGATVQRPGLATINYRTGAQPTAVYDNGPWRGLFWDSRQAKAFGVDQLGSVHRITMDYGNREFIIDEYGATGSDGLTPLKDGTNARAYFTTDGSIIYICTGGRIAKFDNSAWDMTAWTGGTEPESVDQIAYIDGYIMAIDRSSDVFYFNGPVTRGDWSALDFASAVGNPDKLQALRIVNRQIFLFGANSTEVWENDGVSPFSRISGGFYEQGLAGQDAVATVGTELYWLNHDRHIVRYSNGSIQRVSTAVDKEIQTLQNVTDCQADHFEFQGVPFLKLHFISDDATFALNIKTGDWSRWGQYDSSTATYLGFPAACLAWCPGTWWGVHLVGGSGSNGYDSLYRLDATEYFDKGVDEIRMKRLTGHISYGTNKLKRSNGITLRCKRGTGISSGTPQLMVRWRDDGRDWSNEHHLDLGDIGETEIVRRLHTRGVYRTRQYEFACSEDVPGIFLDAEEDVEVLR